MSERHAVAMPAAALVAARAAVGFMPDDEGMALFDLGLSGAELGPLLEIGSYCGKSAIYLGAAARQAGTALFSIDHHRGSEENQPGQRYHDPRLVDGDGRLDTLPWFRQAIAGADLEETVVAIVGRSDQVAHHWSTPLGLVFIDGGHSEAAAQGDYDAWSGFLVPGGILAIHDVFADPKDGGRPPYELYCRAVDDGFTDISATGSLRVLLFPG
jgi:predicted O-methyltransferase YrrM